MRTVTNSALAIFPSAAISGEYATNLWAFVHSDGDVPRGSGVISATNASSGTYDVTFSQDVSQCGYQVTSGFYNVVTGASSDSSNDNIVNVRTGIYKGGGGGPAIASNVNATFHLAVFC